MLQLPLRQENVECVVHKFSCRPPTAISTRLARHFCAYCYHRNEMKLCLWTSESAICSVRSLVSTSSILTGRALPRSFISSADPFSPMDRTLDLLHAKQEIYHIAPLNYLLKLTMPFMDIGSRSLLTGCVKTMWNVWACPWISFGNKTLYSLNNRNWSVEQYHAIMVTFSRNKLAIIFYSIFIEWHNALNAPKPLTISFCSESNKVMPRKVPG